MGMGTRDINRLLGRAGLATLEDPRGFLQQCGFLMRSHDDFRQLLNKVLPQYRRDAYESLRPYLSFEPKPLDVYIAELGQDAERRQLPTLNADGTLRPFRAGDLAVGQAALDAAAGQPVLTMTCSKCTRQAQFHGERKVDAVMAARLAGWAYDSFEGGREICPSCLQN